MRFVSVANIAFVALERVRAMKVRDDVHKDVWAAAPPPMHDVFMDQSTRQRWSHIQPWCSISVVSSVVVPCLVRTRWGDDG
jgi:hypothetical protein